MERKVDEALVSVPLLVAVCGIGLVGAMYVYQESVSYHPDRVREVYNLFQAIDTLQVMARSAVLGGLERMIAEQGWPLMGVLLTGLGCSFMGEGLLTARGKRELGEIQEEIVISKEEQKYIQGAVDYKSTRVKHSMGAGPIERQMEKNIRQMDLDLLLISRLRRYKSGKVKPARGAE